MPESQYIEDPGDLHQRMPLSRPPASAQSRPVNSYVCDVCPSSTLASELVLSDVQRAVETALAYVGIMRPPSVALFVSFSCTFIPFVASVFADEAYRIDYHHVLLGTPQRDTTFFHRPSTSSKASLLYTLSEKLVLGAVNPKDGAVVWRQWLKQDQKEDYDKGYLKALDGEDIVVSAVGNTVNAWDAADGKLVWAWPGEGAVNGLEVLAVEGMKGDVIVATEAAGKNIVTRLGASSGKVVWATTIAR